ncbi:MAG: nucleotidyltransferase family protein [Motiliproteus sp.]|nr:nucleotidyltransferase family protein [Motiliproteus sp.]MCW9053079.1 nucleotidyltransferase family protein [Motiliproteus sp.]
MRAMILAAGLGTRMRPLTDHCPKPMLRAAGQTLIEHQVKRLVAAGFDDIVINLSYLGEQIEAYLGDGSQWQARIRYSKEDKPLETGGGIFQALPLLSDGNQPFLLVNGDIWSDIDYRQLPRQLDGLAHLVMVDNPDHNCQGDFCLRNGLLAELQDDCQGVTFAGVSVLSPQLFSGQKSGVFPLAPLLREAMANELVSGQHHAGLWLDVGTPQRLQQLDRLLIQKELMQQKKVN